MSQFPNMTATRLTEVLNPVSIRFNTTDGTAARIIATALRNAGYQDVNSGGTDVTFKVRNQDDIDRITASDFQAWINQNGGTGLSKLEGLRTYCSLAPSTNLRPPLHLARFLGRLSTVFKRSHDGSLTSQITLVRNGDGKTAQIEGFYPLINTADGEAIRLSIKVSLGDTQPLGMLYSEGLQLFVSVGPRENSTGPDTTRAFITVQSAATSFLTTISQCSIGVYDSPEGPLFGIAERIDDLSVAWSVLAGLGINPTTLMLDPRYKLPEISTAGVSAPPGVILPDRPKHKLKVTMLSPVGALTKEHTDLQITPRSTMLYILHKIPLMAMVESVISNVDKIRSIAIHAGLKTGNIDLTTTNGISMLWFRVLQQADTDKKLHSVFEEVSAESEIFAKFLLDNQLFLAPWFKIEVDS